VFAPQTSGRPARTHTRSTSSINPVVSQSFDVAQQRAGMPFELSKGDAGWPALYPEKTNFSLGQA
jgi:hypothetical protein